MLGESNHGNGVGNHNRIAFGEEQLSGNYVNDRLCKTSADHWSQVGRRVGDEAGHLNIPPSQPRQLHGSLTRSLNGERNTQLLLRKRKASQPPQSSLITSPPARFPTLAQISRSQHKGAHCLAGFRRPGSKAPSNDVESRYTAREGLSGSPSLGKKKSREFRDGRYKTKAHERSQIEERQRNKVVDVMECT